jgi:hypothetical protein
LKHLTSFFYFVCVIALDADGLLIRTSGDRNRMIYLDRLFFRHFFLRFTHTMSHDTADSDTLLSADMLEITTVGLPDARIIDSLPNVTNALKYNLQAKFDKIAEGQTNRIAMYKDILKLLTKNIDQFQTYEQYLWLFAFSYKLTLAQDKIDLFYEENQYQYLFNMLSFPDEEWAFDADKLNEMTANVFEYLDRISNLFIVCNRMAFKNKTSFYVSVAIVWAGLYRYFDIPIEKYQIHSVDHFISLLAKVKLSVEKMDLVRLFEFLKLFQLYENLVLLAEHRRGQHQCYEKCFETSPTVLKVIKDWINRLMDVIEVIRRNNKESTNVLVIHELLNLDMLPLLDKRFMKLDAYDEGFGSIN